MIGPEDADFHCPPDADYRWAETNIFSFLVPEEKLMACIYTVSRPVLGVMAADIVVFDPTTVGSTNRGERRYDLPGGEKRMVMPSHGVEYTIVNGDVIYASGELVGSGSGHVLQS